MHRRLNILAFGLLFCTAFYSQASWASVEGLPYFEATDLTPYWSPKPTEGHVPAAVQTFRAIDQNGNSVSEAQLGGKISVVSFFFSQCGSTCPKLMHSIQAFQKVLNKRGLSSQVQIYSISVTPEHDSPEVLRDYAHARSFDLSNWSLVTGNRDEIYKVGKEVFKADRSVGKQRTSSSFIHSDNLYLMDSQKRIRGIYSSSNSGQMTLLAQDIQKLGNI